MNQIGSFYQVANFQELDLSLDELSIPLVTKNKTKKKVINSIGKTGVNWDTKLTFQFFCYFHLSYWNYDYAGYID